MTVIIDTAVTAVCR